MVSTQQEKVLRILDFVGKQEADYFQWLLASVYVISQEQIVGLAEVKEGVCERPSVQNRWRDRKQPLHQLAHNQLTAQQTD